MMTDCTSLQSEIGSILFQSLHVEVPLVHEDLIETGLLDSLKIVELLVELEQHFAIRIPLRELEIDSFRSLGAIANFVIKLKTNGIPSSATGQAPPDHRGNPFITD